MARKRKLVKILLHTKPAKILLELVDGPKYATVISKKIDCTYSHTVKLLDLFKDFELVEFEKKGRIKIIRLTEKGEIIARALQNLITSISEL